MISDAGAEDELEAVVSAGLEADVDCASDGAATSPVIDEYPATLIWATAALARESPKMINFMIKRKCGFENDLLKKG